MSEPDDGTTDQGLLWYKRLNRLYDGTGTSLTKQRIRKIADRRCD